MNCLFFFNYILKTGTKVHFLHHSPQKGRPKSNQCISHILFGQFISALFLFIILCNYYPAFVYPAPLTITSRSNFYLSTNGNQLNQTIDFFTIPNFSQDSLDNLVFSIQSWISIFPQSNIYIVFSGNDPQGFSTNFKRLKRKIHYKKLQIFQVPIETDEIGIVYIDDLFFKMFEYSKADMICFLEPKTILPAETQQKIIDISAYYQKRNQTFAITGKRCVLQFPGQQIPESSNFSISFLDSFTHFLSTEDLLRNINFLDNSQYSNDFFFISRNGGQLDFDDIPPFHYGFFAWDTWLLGWMNERIPVVSLGNECASYNYVIQTHGGFNQLIADNFNWGYIKGSKFMVASDLQLKYES